MECRQDRGGRLRWVAGLHAVVRRHHFPRSTDRIEISVELFAPGEITEQPRTEGAWFDDEHFDTEGCHLAGQRLGHPFERKLGGTVCGKPGKRHLTSHAAHLYDRTCAPGSHVGQNGADEG